MNHINTKLQLIVAVLFLSLPKSGAHADDTQWTLFKRFQAITDHSGSAHWSYRTGDYVDVLNLYHTEGMTRVGSQFYVSSVGITTMPNKNECYPGQGKGYLHKFSISNSPVTPDVIQIPVESDRYHPGGIDAADYDEAATVPFIYIPMATYLPGSDFGDYGCSPTATVQLLIGGSGFLHVLEAPFHNHLSSAMVSDSAGRKNLVYSTWGTTTWELWVSDDSTQFWVDPKATTNNEETISFQDCQHFESESANVGLKTFFLCSGPGKGDDPNVRNADDFQTALTTSPFYYNSGLGLVSYNNENGEVISEAHVTIPSTLYTQIGNDYKSYPLQDNSGNYYPPLSYNPFLCETSPVPTAVQCRFVPTPQEASYPAPITYTGRMYLTSLSPGIQIVTNVGKCIYLKVDGSQTSPSVAECNNDVSRIWSLVTVWPFASEGDFQIWSKDTDSETEECIDIANGGLSVSTEDCATQSSDNYFTLSPSGRIVDLPGNYCLDVSETDGLIARQMPCSSASSVFALNTEF